MTATAPATTGMTVLDLAQAGRFEEIRDLFAPPLRAMVPAEAAATTSRPWPRTWRAGRLPWPAART
jgi:hypothetical protein